MSPVAAFEERDGDFRVVAKFLGKLWEAKIDHSPLDIVAWHGTYVPYKYDLTRFNTINTVTYDHPDPSIFSVLTAPTATPGTANIDFGVIARPLDRRARTRSARRRFIATSAASSSVSCKGRYIGKAEGFAPGCASLHNCMSGHGPDNDAFEHGAAAGDAPQYFADTLTIIFETQLVIRPTRFALESGAARARLLPALARLEKTIPTR